MKDLVLSLWFCTSWPYKPGKDLRLAWRRKHRETNDLGRSGWDLGNFKDVKKSELVGHFLKDFSLLHKHHKWRLVNYINFLHNLQILWKCLVESCLVHFRANSLLKCMGWNLMMTWWHYNSPIIGLTRLVILGPASPVPHFPSYSPSNAIAVGG